MKEPNMDKTKFIQVTKEVIDYYKNFYKIDADTRLYFKFNLLNVKNIRENKKTKEEYFKQFEQETCIITKFIENIYDYFQKTYPELHATFYPPAPEIVKKMNKLVKIEIIGREIDPSTIINIETNIKTEKMKEKNKVLECFKKQMKLKETDTIRFCSFSEEGNLHNGIKECEGTAIISGKLYTDFELKFSEKKGFYLSKIKPIKIIDLDKKEV
ncbi:MAG: hypothetical protein WC108_04525 [Bacteroidales bacterium]